MKPDTSFIANELGSREASGRLRKLHKLEPAGENDVISDRVRLQNLCSNDYLGLSKHPDVIEAASEATKKYGAGSTSSRLVSGSYSVHHELEDSLARWLEREEVLVFNSGFQMNVGIIAAIADKDTQLYYDKKNHNSLLQGALLSKAKLHRYRHADYRHLNELLERHSSETKKNIIITESVFSMDGDTSDLTELSDLADKFGAMLIVDEAHAIGVCGNGGRGYTFGIDRVDMVLGTFGKAFGSFGAFTACSREMKDYLINVCSAFIYTTALPPGLISATQKSLNLMDTFGEDRAKLQELSAWFRSELAASGFDTGGSTSHIIPVILGEEEKALKISDLLQKGGFLVQPIRPPTVESGKSRLRFTLNRHVSKNALMSVLQILRENVRNPKTS